MEILNLFYLGCDTLEIAEILKMPEPQVLRQLHDERDQAYGKKSQSARIVPPGKYHSRRWEILP